jgi:Fic family protein
MRLPEPAVDPYEALKSPAIAGRVIHILTQWTQPEVEGEYLHWDELRRRTLPAGIGSNEDWWLAIAFARRRTHLPLKDKEQRLFWVSQPQSVQRGLHQLDRLMGFTLTDETPIEPNSELKDMYLASALVEESITSSQLEGASTTRRVAREMLRSGRAPATRDERMIANNFEAMRLIQSDRGRRPLDLGFLLELHRILTAGTLDDPDEEGRLRRPGENIQVMDESDGTSLHLPPPAEDLPSRLATLMKFANASDGAPFLHPILRAAVLHFALGYEHPFVDGNGRTARALLYWSLLRSKYWLAEYLSISSVIKKAPAQYSRAFLHSESASGDVTYFVVHQLHVLERAVDDLKKLVGRKVSEARELDRLLRGDESLNHRQRALLSHALRHPHFRYTVEAHRASHQVVTQTARTDLLQLSKLRLLIRNRAGKRFTFEAPADLEHRLRRLPARKR